MKIKAQKLLAVMLIRMHLRDYARQKRRTHDHHYLNATFQYAAAGSVISFAKCCEVITEAHAIKFCARLNSIHRAQITRAALKAAA